MRVSTWAGATAGAALVYYLDDLRGAERRRRLSSRVATLWSAIEGRRRSRHDLDLDDALIGESSFDWPLSVVTIDIDKALDR